MPCYYPITGFRAKYPNEKGLRPVYFMGSASKKGVVIDAEKVTVPCGQCIGCRLDYARNWAIRCVHEARMHDHNQFITLTYNRENVPADGKLNKRHLQLFWKKVRKVYGQGIKYYSAGEYGEAGKRPHYHACVFGLLVSDKEVFTQRQGVPLFRSDSLSKIWGKGFVTIGDVTFDSASYVARYVVKKQKGEKESDEFALMSRRPGIGRTFYEKYKRDILNIDAVIVRGHKQRTPRYYDSIYDVENHDDLQRRKEERRKKVNMADQTVKRRQVKEYLVKKQLKDKKEQRLWTSL